jgi:hypothetical protein
MAGKRVGLALATGLLTLLGTIPPKGDLETIVAQDAKPVAEEKVALSTYQQFSQNFYDIGEDFYKKGKDKDKALEALGIAAYFDPSNKQITDLIQKVEKDNKLKKNERESKKVEEKYSKTKNETIETLYQNGVEKAKTNKDEAQDIFYTILQIDKNSTKFDEALEKELNWKKIDGYLLPPEIAGAREKGMKYLNDASEGVEDKTEDDLVATLKVENDKIFRRKSKDIIVRSTLNEESAKRAHKVSEATMKLLMEYLGLEGKPPYNVGDEKSTDREPTHRITILTNDDQMDKFAKSTTAPSYRPEYPGLNQHETWKSRNQEVKGYGHFHKYDSFDKNDQISKADLISNCTLYDILSHSSEHINSELDRNSPWFYHSFISQFTWQLLGTTKTFYLIDREDKYEGKIEKVTKVKTAEQMRAGAYFLSLENKLMPINMLSRLKFDQFSDQAKATAFAATEYLIHNHKDKLVELLTDEYNKKTDLKDLSKYEIIEKHIGLTPEQFDKNVQEFVLKKYVGLRNYQN